MKQMRPFNWDDISAVISWLLLGNTLWIFIGTTSFISFSLWAANSLQFEDWFTNKMGTLLTNSSQAIITFESATPNWKDGKIRLSNVHVVSMPRSEQRKFQLYQQEKEPTIIQGDLLANIELDEDEKTPAALKRLVRVPWFDLTVDTIEVEVSLLRLLEGKGIIKSADVRGVRGIIDNRRSGWNKHSNWDAEAVRKSHIPGDFEIDRLSLEDLSVIVFMPKGFRPFPLSVIYAHLSRLRKQWLLYDFLCADSIIGSIDSSLFSIHTPLTEKSVFEFSDLESNKDNTPSLAMYYPFNNKKVNPAGVLVGGENQAFGLLLDDGMNNKGYRRKSRLRIESVSVDHIHRFGDGPPQWITSGTVDFCADIYIPNDQNISRKHPSFVQIFFEFARKSLPKSVIIGIGRNQKHYIIGESRVRDNDKEGDEKTIEEHKIGKEKNVVLDIDVRFKDVKGVVPLKIPDISYVNSAMVRPLIAYINRNKTIVPIKGRIVIDLDNFNGAYTVYDSTLAERLNKAVTKGFLDLVHDQQERNKRMKQIGFWSFRELFRNIQNFHDCLYGTARGFWNYLGR
ncbi:mitochondrial distribution and morphology protein family 31/32 [Mycotypha africana]|uniref:mitochondrial distribution and morphology protein family 31/32 n=1 Tax=Mycotypha africana TaxID=64632 RepID=UPI0023011290|nr:mitochondrial distribution and morphology protein family 31/32 [Mycotypha africana]KAI8973171.1 mitochondrial distribution and morphology protein family 31/32 [Mycotypha africana]